MEFEVVFFEDAHGHFPVIELLEQLRASQPTLHRLLAAGLSKLQYRDQHGLPLTRQVDSDNGIFELRVGRDNIARVFFCFQPDRQIFVTNGYVKKQQRLDRRELEWARRYQTDWLERLR